MGMGHRRRERQDEFWMTTGSLPGRPRQVFYEKLNKLLAESGFDEFVEGLCEPFYAGSVGQNSIPPGVYFRMLFIDYFEGIAWRCAGSCSLSVFLGYGPFEATPDHSSLTNTRKRLSLEVHDQVFGFILQMAEDHNLLRGKTIAVEANAAMKSIVRKETDEDLRRFDKKRKNKMVSNDEWESQTDPDSRITKMKDSRTHLAYKAEHVIDLESEVILSAEVYHADQGDTETLLPSMDPILSLRLEQRSGVGQ